MISSLQFNNIFDFFKAFPNEHAAIEKLEEIRWHGNAISPFDKDSIVYKCKNGKYRCSKTRKYFNVKTGTIFENTKLKLDKFFLAIYLFLSNRKGISSYQLARDLGITQKTAWLLLHKIRHAMTHSIYNDNMSGIVEMDETFVGGKNKNRHKDKKVEKSQGRSFKDKTPVFGMLQRSNGKTPSRVICQVVPNTQAKSIQPIITEKVKKNSTIMTDEWQAYNGMESRYNRFYVDHGRGQYADDNGVTTNRIENFWSCFKRTLNGAYNNRVSSKHLQRYADESTFRFNARENKQDQTMCLFLQTATQRKLTYKELVYGKT